MEIYIGDKFKCIENVIMNSGPHAGEIIYTRGKEYQSEDDGCITDDMGHTAHWWADSNTFEAIEPDFSQHFVVLMSDEKIANEARRLIDELNVLIKTAAESNIHISVDQDIFTDIKALNVVVRKTIII